MSNLINLIERLTEGTPFIETYHGNVYCFFCGAYLEGHDPQHEDDCPYIEARQVLGPRAVYYKVSGRELV